MSAARDFTKVSPAVWRSSRFLALSDKGKIGFLYFLTNAHVPSSGIYYLPDGYACADLQWDMESYRQIRADIVSAGMIDWDEEHSIVLIERWFKFNPPANDDHAKGTLRRLQEIESDRLREKAIAAFEEADALRLERAAQKAAEKASRRKDVADVVGNTSRLLSTRLMGGAHG